MANISFIEKCFQKWKEENPDGTEYEFYLLCRMWRYVHESTYGMTIKHDKTPQDMYDEGWCKGCKADYAECHKKGICEGYKIVYGGDNN